VKDFYTAFHAAVEHSRAYATFCERAFGLDLSQHGFADREQLDLLVQVTQLGPAHRALDLGCGNGRIAEYLSDRTGAHFTGLDYIPEAICQAQRRTAAKAERLAFVVGNLNQPDLPSGPFDLVLSIDSLYFSEDYAATLRAWRAALRPGGQMAIFYSYGREPWVPLDEFPKEALPPDKTPLAVALRANGLAFRTWDLTRQDYAGAVRRQAILAELKPRFEAEGTLFIHDNRAGDAGGVGQALEAGLHRRHLYHVQL
jgi:SAM-dependent methyltransferase